MTDTRLQDRIDAQRLLQFTPALDVSRVCEHLARITKRGYAREQDLDANCPSCSATLVARREMTKGPRRAFLSGRPGAILEFPDPRMTGNPGAGCRSTRSWRWDVGERR
jgi:hypothetical protein